MNSLWSGLATSTRTIEKSTDSLVCGVCVRSDPDSVVMPVGSVDPGGPREYCGSTASQPSSPHVQTPSTGILGRFQTNPRGVEARTSVRNRASGRGSRRTLVGSKHRLARRHVRLPLAVPDEPSWGRSSRRAKGLYEDSLVPDEPSWGRSAVVVIPAVLHLMFQTNPCGVEVARKRTKRRRRSACFRRTLVGSKTRPERRTDQDRGRFRRTLVGSKLRHGADQRR